MIKQKILVAVIIVVLLVGCFSTLVKAESFGNTSIGGTSNVNNYITIGSVFTLTEDADIDYLMVYADGDGQDMLGSIYDSVAGVPTNRLDVSSTPVVLDAVGWYNITMNHVHLVAGDYFLMYSVGVVSPDWHNYYDVAASGKTYYKTGVNSPSTLDSPSAIGWVTSVYAGYTNPSPTPSATPTPTATTDPLLIGLIIFALFTGLCFYLMLKPHGTINFVVGILMLSVTGFLAVGQYFGSLWIIAFAGAIFGLITMLRGTDLM